MPWKRVWIPVPKPGAPPWHPTAYTPDHGFWKDVYEESPDEERARLQVESFKRKAYNASLPPPPKTPPATPKRLAHLQALVAEGKLTPADADRLAPTGRVSEDAWRAISGL